MKRETSSYERVMFYMGNLNPLYFAFKIRVNNNISESELKEALLKVQKKHPLAGIRVEMTPDKKQFITTENVPEIPLREFNAGETDWKTAVNKELQTCFDIFKGPIVKASMIKRSGITDIIIVFHHAICDGLSSVIFLKDLFLFLADPGLPVNPYMEAPPLIELIKKDVIDIIEEKELPGWIKDSKVPESKPHEEETLPWPDFAIHNWSFPEEQTNKIVSFARRNNVSVHSVLGAVLLRAFSLELNKKDGFKEVIQSPVSFRPFMIKEAKDYFGLFIGILKAEINCSMERAINEMALEIYTKLKSQLDDYEPLTGYYFFGKYFLKNIEDPELFYANRPRRPLDYDFSLSNLGRIPLQKKYGDYEIEDIYGPIFSAINGEIVFGVNTHQERMFFTCTYDKKCFNYATASRIIQKALDIFEEITG